MKKFVHLHCHSEYSLLDGAAKVENLIRKAESLKMPSLAITEHGNLFSCIKFYKQAMTHGIKPIIGCEVYVAENLREKKPKEIFSHLTILVKDEIGYHNLIKLVSISYLDGFYYRPRIDKNLLFELGKGLIVLSGCQRGPISRLILEEKIDDAEEEALEYLSVFGNENFFLEILNHNIPEEKTIKDGIVEIGKKLSIGIVATNDVHYLEKDDYDAHDVLLCIQTGKKRDDEKRLKFSTDELYFKSEEEMKALFSDIPEAIENTHYISEKCNLELEFGRLHLPRYRRGSSSFDETLHNLCIEGLNEKYPHDETARERLEYELSVISKMGYSGYFLIIHDLISYAKRENIPVGPGRGSVAGSLVAYCLGITDIDPLKYGLLFERFLNPARVTMPDIDIDFCYRRRDEILGYVAEEYGKEQVAQIITFGTMLAKAVIRDVGRVLNFSYSECDRLAKLIGNEPTLSDALKNVPDFAREYEDEEKKFLIDIAMRLERLVRHASTHAAGLVIGNKPLIELVPLYKDPQEGRIATQYSKDDLEEVGLLKMDFLGLVNLTVIEDTINLIKEKKGIEIDIRKIPLNDKKTYDLLSSGSSTGLFQLESSGMQDLLKRIQPTNFEDLIAILALHRPGPLKSGMVASFIEGKHGRKKPEYFSHSLKSILSPTYGVIVYQEQVMQIAEVLAGFSKQEADELRRAMGKKDESKMKNLKDEFIKGCIRHNHSSNLAEKVYELLSRFAEYGFNKSHSAAYAIIAYQTSYLKANYPEEFIASLLSCELNNQDKITLYVGEARRMGINILPPDINDPTVSFAIRDNGIRFSLAAIKHVGESATRSIVEARKDGPFTSIMDFCERVDSRLVNKRVIESLIKVGAFDGFGLKRASLSLVVDEVLQKVGRAKKSKQTTLFEEIDEVKLPDVPEWKEGEKLTLEKEFCGVYFSGHPLERFRERLLRYRNISSIIDDSDGSLVTIAGMIKSVKKTKTKNGEDMAFIQIEDLNGSCEGILFPKAYQAYNSFLKKEDAVVVKGRVDKKDDIKLIANEILEIDEQGPTSCHLRLNPDDSEKKLYKIRDIISNFSGNYPFYIHIQDSGKERVFVVSPKFYVDINEELIFFMKNIAGEENIWVA